MERSHSLGRGDWTDAPPVVRGWAYQLTWLGIVFSVLGILVFLFSSEMSTGGRLGGMLFYLALLVLLVWLNRAMKRGLPVAWAVQLILSVLGLLAFPLGTAIHGYILSQWFKPETRAWFEQG